MKKRFAANRICRVSDCTVLSNQVVEVDETSRCVVCVFALEGEIRHTEWLGGVILLSNHLPVRNLHESFAAFLKRENELSEATSSCSLQAYHVTSFNVHEMEFTEGSRIILL